MDRNDEETPITEKVQDIMKECDENQQFDSIGAAIEHLMLYSFRGRSVIKPFYNDDGLVVKRLNNWNVMLRNQRFYWNPESSLYVADLNQLAQIPQDEIVFCTTERPIDLPGMLIYLRQTVGETRWSQFVEREGIPQVLITAPEGTPDSALPIWTKRAQQIMNGGSGVLPPGSKVDQLTAARGQDPFSEFCRHQMEMVAILATGGSLNTIGGNTGLGSNLAEMQNEQFKKIVNRDVKNVEKAMTKIARFVARKEGLDAADVRFKFDREEDRSDKALEYAERLKRLGATVDVEKVKKYISMDLVADDVQENVWQPTENNNAAEEGKQQEVKDVNV